MTRLPVGTVVRECRCGASFVSTRARQKYCSAKCGAEAESANRRAARVGGPGKGWAAGRQTVPRRSCEVCGKEFYAPPVLVRRGGGRFCGNDCRGRYIATHVEEFPQTKNRRGNGGRRADLEDRYFRSSWEANYARYLNWLIAHGQLRSWEYEPTTFEFPVKRGQRFYTPDFFVTENSGDQAYHEVKGWMDPRSATKLARMAKHHPGVRIVLIDANAYRDIARSVGDLIEGWETIRGQAARWAA